MGLSSKKSTVKTTENTSQNATVTPQNPEWVTGALSDYTDRIGAFGNMDPNSFVAPASPLQQRAWGAAGNMGGWQGQTALASQMANRAANSPANLGGQASTYQAPNMGQAGQAGYQGYSAPDMGSAAQATANGYVAPNLGNAGLIQASSYNAPTLGNSQGYAAARVGSPIGATSQGYQSTGAANETISPVSNATASAGADNMARYQNPFLRDVVDTTLGDMDREMGRLRARQASEAARNGAFGGSRYGIREAETEGEIARARASTAAGLRSQGFNTAAGLGMADADRTTQASMFNAGSANTRNLAQADMNSRTSMFNAQSRDQASQFGADAANRTSMFNADAGNRAALTQAGLDSDASRFGADASNQFALTRAGLAADAGQFNASQGQQAALANQGAQNQFALTRAGLEADAAQFGAAAGNQANMFNAGQRNDFTSQQAALAAQAAQFGAGAANQASLFNTGARNDFASQQAALQAQAGQFNAGAQNQMSMFNAGQQDNADARMMQGAGMMGDLANSYASNYRGDLGLMAGMGEQQQAVEQAYRTAPLSQLQAMGALYGATPFDLFKGVNTTGTSTGTGTNVTKQGGSALGSAFGLASLFAPSF